MVTFRIELSNEDVRRIKELAQEHGLPPEELLQRGVQEWAAER